MEERCLWTEALTWFQLFAPPRKKACVCAVKQRNSQWPPVVPALPPFLDSGHVPCRSTTRGDDCPSITSPSPPLQPVSLQTAASHGEGPSKCTKHSKTCVSIALKHTVISMDVSFTLLVLDFHSRNREQWQWRATGLVETIIRRWEEEGQLMNHFSLLCI